MLSRMLQSYLKIYALPNDYPVRIRVRIGPPHPLVCRKRYAYSSAAPDPAFTIVGGPCCPTLEFVIIIWITITFYTLITSLSIIWIDILQ